MGIAFNPLHNGDGDSSRIRTALEDALLDHITNGHAVEPCYFHRIREGLELRYRQRQLDAGIAVDRDRSGTPAQVPAQRLVRAAHRDPPAAAG